MAVTEWVPVGSDVVVNVALPFERVPTPSGQKVTVPVGVPAPAATVAVNVTELPTALGLGEALSEVVVEARLAVSMMSANADLADSQSSGFSLQLTAPLK